jgi:uncharacterized protein
MPQSLVRTEEQSEQSIEPSSTVHRSHAQCVWIDLDNSPHVPFFAPIVEQLECSGYRVLITARDCFQVCDLADLHKLNYRRIGHHNGKNRVLKLAGLCWRALQLAPEALRQKPALAVSHGSRSQSLIASTLRIPTVIIGDYEFARVLISPTWFITPEIIPDANISGRQGHILKYPGIKEDVYVPAFRPLPGILERLGIDGHDVLVLVRPPATEAHYHRPESDELFEAALNFLGTKPHVKIVLLPRNERQAESIRARWPNLFSTGQIIVPNEVVDGLNLIWYSDLVISGGGTMNREAAALGVPVYSIFRGKIGAVDRYLAATGRMTLIEATEELETKLHVVKRDRRMAVQVSHSPALASIVNHLTSILEKTRRTARHI